MKILYDLNEAPKLLKKKKILLWSILPFALLVFGVTIPCSVFHHEDWVMALDIILVTLFGWYVFTVFVYFRKELNYEYHFLAEIEQYEHKVFENTVVSVGEHTMTIEHKLVYPLELDDGHCLYLEQDKDSPVFHEKKKLRLETVNLIIIGYEECKDE